jgi:hypothetical protein
MSEWSLRPDLPSATFDVDEECPHCDEPQPSRQMDTHVATVHADLPPCTARIETQHRETYQCVFRAGHAKGEYGRWHASASRDPAGRFMWNDSAAGATPHRPPEPSDSLNKLKAAGVVSHTVVATGDGSPARTCGEHDGPCFPEAGATCSAHGEQQCARCHRNPSDCLTEDGACGRWSSSGMHWDTCPNRRRGPLTDADSAPQPPERPVKATCAVLHTDEQGNTIPCPHEQAKGDPNFTLNEINGKWRWLCGNCNGYSRNFPTADEAQGDFYARHAPCLDEQADPHPALTAKLYAPPPDDRLRDAEIRAAVAEHEAEAYKNQVQALVRALLRERGAAEEDLPQKVSVIILHEEAP